jgi:hypothetical protein
MNNHKIKFLTYPQESTYRGRIVVENFTSKATMLRLGLRRGACYAEPQIGNLSERHAELENSEYAQRT